MVIITVIIQKDKIKFSIIFLILLILTPAVVNLYDILGFGPIVVKKSYRFDYSTGSGYVNTKLIIDYIPKAFTISTEFSYLFYISMESSGSVKIASFSYIGFSLYLNGKHISAPIADTEEQCLMGWGAGNSLTLYRNDNLSIKGIAIAKFETPSIIQNETIYFELSYVMEKSFYDYFSGLYGVVFLQIIFFVSLMICFFLSLKIFKIKRDL